MISNNEMLKLTQGQGQRSRSNMVKAHNVVTQRELAVSTFQWSSKVLFMSIQTNLTVITFCLII